jgi:hypothetical protein
MDGGMPEMQEQFPAVFASVPPALVCTHVRFDPIDHSPFAMIVQCRLSPS